MTSQGHSEGANGEFEAIPHLRSKIGTIGPDGFPVLPPIRKPKPKDDPYAKSKLMTYHLAAQNEALLRQIL